MAETLTLEKLYAELIALRREVRFLTTHFADAEALLSPEEDARLDETLQAHEQGKTIPLEILKSELGD